MKIKSVTEWVSNAGAVGCWCSHVRQILWLECLHVPQWAGLWVQACAHTHTHKGIRAHVQVFKCIDLSARFPYGFYWSLSLLYPPPRPCSRSLCLCLSVHWWWRNDGMLEGKSLVSWKLVWLYQKRLWQYSMMMGQPNVFPISTDQPTKSLPGRNNQQSGGPSWKTTVDCSLQGIFLTL